ncbi:hypothetical protein ASPZODRAFT_154858 [Penicilliopsis zonata CBS 506.65]|uniref:Roadblock/LAMTOR2 domain-containing protein n=1 Tax=Penicilliopsis zonata CBS 506.65 TaxID=1073090 RepID=A0A1L9S7L4_9EURO|nr:hypothetical protein ASPZODRAFT_154858 [Penicilliopsis zonata CBS 506.65]OJJ43143.1 hypothetical protein ASPZODRAFT_154858 [Penicilliopsis zonata CBS 506.65]
MPNSSQVPQHVTTLLSHLTSRAGVQSTLILSRKDGSIIQCTGLLAENATSTPSTSTPTPDPTISPASPNLTTNNTTEPLSPTNPTPNTTTTTAYRPSQAETLAAHIFSYVRSASELSLCLSHPGAKPSTTTTGANGSREGENGGEVEGEEYGDGDGEGDWEELKLLRLRSKRHEIVVVPDRKYLLCVIQDGK